MEIGAHCLKVGGKRNDIVILPDKFLAARLASITIHNTVVGRHYLAVNALLQSEIGLPQ